jgi:hypothetical protein
MENTKSRKHCLLIAFISLTCLMSSQIKFHHIINPASIRAYGFRLEMTPPGGGGPVVFDLCQKTKGVIEVEDNQIIFDPWHITWDCPRPRPAGQPVQTAQPPGVTWVDSSTVYCDAIFQFVNCRATAGRPRRSMLVPFRAYNMGLLTFPFRYRLPAHITGDDRVGVGTEGFDLAFYIGRTIGWSHITTKKMNNYSITFGIYGGPSTTELTQDVYYNQKLWEVDQTRPTLMYGLCSVFARNNLGFVFGIGLERAFGSNSDQWIYNDRPFIAFGISTDFGE